MGRRGKPRLSLTAPGHGHRGRPLRRAPGARRGVGSLTPHPAPARGRSAAGRPPHDGVFSMRLPAGPSALRFFAAAALLVAAARPAAADPIETYIALGDSVAFGETNVI